MIDDMMNVFHSRLNEMTIPEFRDKQKTIFQLYPKFKERVAQVKTNGGIKLLKETPDRWEFSIASGTRPGYVRHELNLVFDNLSDLIYEALQNDIVWNGKGSDIDYNKLSQWVMPKVDIRLSCSCENFLYGGFRYILTKANSVWRPKEKRAPVKRNPKQLGAGCKHFQAVFDQLPFYSQVFAKHLKKYYAKVIKTAVGEYIKGQFPDVEGEDAGEESEEDKALVKIDPKSNKKKIRDSVRRKECFLKALRESEYNLPKKTDIREAEEISDGVYGIRKERENPSVDRSASVNKIRVEKTLNTKSLAQIKGIDKDYKIMAYRATVPGGKIEPGDFITNDLEVAKWYSRDMVGQRGLPEASIKKKLIYADEFRLHPDHEVQGIENEFIYNPRAHNGSESLVEGTKEENFANWFRQSKVVDSDGKPLVVYHGTKRPDRIGTKFDAKRATSGPMAFFTDDKDIASNYAKNKQDTSLAKEEEIADYGTWYKMKIMGQKKPVDLAKAWHYLPSEERQKLKEMAPHVVEDDDGNITTDKNATKGNGGYNLSRHNFNVFAALIDAWLNSGSLYGNEQVFEQVLQKAGADMSKIEYHDPYAEYPSVYPVYLSIQNPLDTSDIPQTVVDALDQVASKTRAKKKGYGVDSWDKNYQDPKEWITNLKKDIEDGTSYVWTSIPDWVTKSLQGFGYDGIKDRGGKYSGDKHSVWVPFKSNQIKSAIGNKGTYKISSNNINESEEEDVIEIVLEPDESSGGSQSKVLLNGSAVEFRESFWDFDALRINDEYEAAHGEDFNSDVAEYQELKIAYELLGIDYVKDAGGVEGLVEPFIIKVVGDAIDDFSVKGDKLSREQKRQLLREELDDLELTLQQEVSKHGYYDKYAEALNDSNISKIAQDFGLSEKEFKDILFKNYQTRGTAAINILEHIEDYVSERELDSIDVDDGDNKEYLYSEAYSLLSVIKSLLTAHRRHTQSGYDLIGKSAMSDEEVKALRKSFNRSLGESEEDSKYIYDMAREYDDMESFVDKVHYKDSHTAPRHENSPVEDRVENGGSFSLVEVANGYSNQPDDYFSPRVGARYCGYDDAVGMSSFRVLRKAMDAIADGNSNVKLVAYRAIPKDVNVSELKDGDWITFSKQYAIDHGERRFGEGEYKVIPQKVEAKNVWWDGSDINEWGYDTGNTKLYSPRELKNIWQEVHAAKDDELNESDDYLSRMKSLCGGML